MKPWHGSVLGGLLALVIGGGSLLFIVPIAAALIIGIPPAFDRLTAYALCPDAAEYSYRDYGFGQPTSSSPTRGTGHYTELTCTNADGNQRTFGNDEVALKGIGASFALAGACGAAVVVALAMIAAMVGGRMVPGLRGHKSQDTSHKMQAPGD
jgi:hypothetical protein